MKCQICKKKDLLKFLSLGHQPPSDAFLEKKELEYPETFFPLDAYYCKNCHLVQLGYTVSPDLLFKEYVYETSMNKNLVRNFSELVDSLIKRFKLTKEDLAVDIGSNDGTLLKNYQKSNIRVLGIDPSSIAKVAIENNVPTINDFFNKRVAVEAIKKYGKAKVITGTNVFAHVAELDSLMKGVKIMLTKDGIFITESHHLLNLIKKMQWDSIYHEHLRYYAIKPLQTLFERFGMQVFDVEITNTHGGSIRVYTCKKGIQPVSDNVQKIISMEKELYDENTYNEFAAKVNKHRQDILKKLIDIKEKGKTIVGLGAPAKGNTLLNSCRIGSNILEYIGEKSNIKIGMYTPGTHIPVVDEKELIERQPDYALILSWNIADILISKTRERGYKGKFIIPYPLDVK